MAKKFPFINSLLVALTLGLAPFSPEPHIWGKLRWISGVGMEFMDYFDLVLHGTPWLWLLFSLLKWSGIFKIKRNLDNT
jgi:hypothetical protein